VHARERVRKSGQLEPWPLTSLRDRLIKIGAKIAGHGRHITFQMADVGLSRQ
jgi:hypothetical protein